jgi:hypothetical protein
MCGICGIFDETGPDALGRDIAAMCVARRRIAAPTTAVSRFFRRTASRPWKRAAAKRPRRFRPAPRWGTSGFPSSICPRPAISR